MRIAVLANADIGLYKFRKELMECLCKKYEVYIILPNGEFIKPLQDLGCKFINFEFNRRGINPFADLKQLFRYIKVLKSVKPDVVLTYTIKPNVYGGMACQWLKVPYIANVTGLGTTIENGGLLSFISTSLYRIGLKKANCVFFQNERNKFFFENKKVVKGKTRLIPGSGVNLDNHNYESYPKDNYEIRFLFVGRIMKDKGIEELLSAAKEVKKELKDILVDVVGFCDENYDTELKEAENEGLIKFYGQQKDVHSFYKKCHCVILPSYHEGMANVMLEGSATGRPVITTNIPGCMETFDEGVTGFGCEPKNTNSLIKAMKKFLALSLSDMEKMGKRARVKMEKQFDRNIVIEAYSQEIDCAANK